MSYTQAVELLKIPEEEREQFVEENHVEDMSTRELKKAIAELEQAKKDKEELKKTSQNAINENLSLKQKMKKIEKESNDVFSKLEESQKQVLEARKETEEYKNKVKELESRPNKVKELESRPVEVVTGVDESKVKELKEEHKKEIQELNSKIAEAQNKLKEMENKESEVIKEVDEGKLKELQEQHEKEIAELKSQIEISKNKVQDLEIKLNDKSNKEASKNTDESLVKFKIHFDGVVSGFKTLISDIEEIDEGSREKYKGAVRGLLNKMLGFI